MLAQAVRFSLARPCPLLEHPIPVPDLLFQTPSLEDDGRLQPRLALSQPFELLFKLGVPFIQLPFEMLDLGLPLSSKVRQLLRQPGDFPRVCHLIVLPLPVEFVRFFRQFGAKGL